MNIKLVIFDFDGTIADTRKAIIISKQETMRLLGLSVASDEECAATIGLSSKLGFKKQYPDLSEEQLDLCVSTYRERFEKNKLLEPPVLFPNVKEVLDSLSKKEIVSTIATSRNKVSCKEFLDQLEIASYFSYVLCAEDTKLLKPNPDPVIKTLKELSYSPSETLVVGDMPMDIEMGKKAGIYTCGVTYGNATRADLLAAGADFVIDNIGELTEILFTES